MAFLVNSNVIITNSRDLVGVNTAGIDGALYVGSDIQADAQVGIITAASFVGSGASLVDIPGLSWVATTAPTVRPDGRPLQEGDIYYDSDNLRQYTRFDNAGSPIWVDSNPAANSALDYKVGSDEGQVIPGLDVLEFATDTNVNIGVNTTTDTLTFGLVDDVEIGTSLQVGAGVSIYSGIVTSANGTPVTYYGDGSNLTGVGFDPSADLITTGNIQAGFITATEQLASTKTLGVGLTVSGQSWFGDAAQFVGSAAANALNSGELIIGKTNNDFSRPANSTRIGIQLTDETVIESDGGINALRFQRDNLGIPENFMSLEFENDLVVLSDGIDLKVGSANSITAGKYYGDGSNLTGVSLDPSADLITTGNIQAGVITATTSLEATAGTGVGLTVTSDAHIGGNLVVIGDVEANDVNTTSDVTKKTNISVIEGALEKVTQLRGVTFDWKSTGAHSGGIIAQDVEQVLPTLVKQGEDHKTVIYNGIVGLLVEAVKDLVAEVEELKQTK